MVKPCIKCGIPKETSIRCHPCHAEYFRQRRKNLPELSAEIVKRYRERNPEWMADYQKSYYQDNRERISERNHQEYLANIERHKELGRQYRANNPEILNAKHHRQRARRRGCEGSHTPAEWQAVLRKYKNKCAHCGCRGKMTKDHIVPISRGGTNFAFNLMPLCGTCNSSKGSRFLPETQHSIFDRLGETG